MPFELPDLSALPMWQQLVAVVVIGITVGIGLLVTRFGFLAGKHGKPAEPETKAQVAAVIVDDKAIKELTGEVAGLQVALLEVAKELRNTGGLQAAIDQLREEIRVMREVANARGK